MADVSKLQGVHDYLQGYLVSVEGMSTLPAKRGKSKIQGHLLICII